MNYQTKPGPVTTSYMPATADAPQPSNPCVEQTVSLTLDALREINLQLDQISSKLNGPQPCSDPKGDGQINSLNELAADARVLSQRALGTLDQIRASLYSA